MLIKYSSPFFIVLRYIHAILEIGMIIFLIFLLMNSYFLTIFRVQGNSMQPNLHNGDVVGVNRLAYLFQEPAVGDMVVISYPEDDNIHFVKRIAAVPGDSVIFNRTQIILTSGQYFVLGDNSSESTDSRTFGAIRREQLVGKIIH